MLAMLCAESPASEEAGVCPPGSATSSSSSSKTAALAPLLDLFNTVLDSWSHLNQRLNIDSPVSITKLHLETLALLRGLHCNRSTLAHSQAPPWGSQQTKKKTRSTAPAGTVRRRTMRRDRSSSASPVVTAAAAARTTSSSSLEGHDEISPRTGKKRRIDEDESQGPRGSSQASGMSSPYQHQHHQPVTSPPRPRTRGKTPLLHPSPAPRRESKRLLAMESQFDSMRSQVTQLLACSQLIVSAATSIEGELQFVGDYLSEIKAAAGPLVEPSSGVDESSREGWDSSPYPSSSIIKLENEDPLPKVTTAITASRETGKDVIPSSLCTEGSASMSSYGLPSPLIKEEEQDNTAAARFIDQRDDAFWAASYQRRQAQQLQQRQERSRANFYRRTDYFGDWEEPDADVMPTTGPSRLPLVDKDKSPNQAASPVNEQESSSRPQRPGPSPQHRLQVAASQDSPEAAHSPALLTLPRQEALAATMRGTEGEEGGDIDEGRDEGQQDAEMLLAGRSTYDEVPCTAWHPPRPWSS